MQISVEQQFENLKHYTEKLLEPKTDSLIFYPDLKNDVKENMSGYNYTPDVKENFESLCQEINKCVDCDLHKTRNKPVIGRGDLSPIILFIGESPKFQEDKIGIPFTGELGIMLNNIITKVLKLDVSQVFITDIVKCRTADDKKPKQYQVEMCKQYTDKLIDIIKPKFICTLGNTAFRALFSDKNSITEIHGNQFYYKDIPVIPTLHPKACLIDPGKKPMVFDDMMKLKKLIKEK